jgi:plasmid stability protein
MNNNKLTKKLQVLLTESEVREVNRVILNEALDTETRPVSISAWIRDLIQIELANKTPDQKSILKDKIKNLKDK